MTSHNDNTKRPRPTRRAATAAVLAGLLAVTAVAGLLLGVFIASNTAGSAQAAPAAAEADEQETKTAEASKTRQHPAPVVASEQAAPKEPVSAKNQKIVASATRLTGASVSKKTIETSKKELTRAEPVEGGAGSLEVVEHSLAHGVSKRVPVDAATRFEVGEKAWAWAAIRNQGSDSSIQMIWSHEGKERFRATLEVGKSPGWRTWSRKTLRIGDVGRWSVDIVDMEGRSLRTMTFDVSRPAP